MPTTGENIRARRQALGMTQRTLALRAETTETTVGRWERDESVPRSDHFDKLAKALETTIGALYSPPVTSNEPPDPEGFAEEEQARVDRAAQESSFIAAAEADIDDMVIP